MGAVARQVSNLPPVYVRGNLIHSDHLEHSTMMMMRVMVMMLVVIVMTNPHLQNHKYAQKRQFHINSIRFFLQTLMMTFELEIFCNFLQDLPTTRQNKIYKHVFDWSKILARVGF